MSSKVFKIVTKQILDQLDNGVVPWKKPWRTLETPRNLLTGKDYRGVNLWLLPRDYTSRYFLTLRQANSLGGKIKKGEKSHLVVFWKMLKVKDDKSNSDVDKEKKEKEKIIPLVGYKLSQRTARLL